MAIVDAVNLGRRDMVGDAYWVNWSSRRCWQNRPAFSILRQIPSGQMWNFGPGVVDHHSSAIYELLYEVTGSDDVAVQGMPVTQIRH